MSIGSILPYPKEVLWEFVLQGPESGLVKDRIFSKHPYKISHHRHPKTWKKKDIGELLTLVQKSKLAERVVPLKRQHNCFIVDKYIKVQGQDSALQKDALKVWRPLERFFLRVTIINSALTASMLLLAFQNVPKYLALAATLGGIVLCFFTGYAGARYMLARNQVSHWNNPGNHLALERTDAKETDFVDLWLNKPKFLNPQGGLLPVEIHGPYVEYFKYFSQSFLDWKCSTPEEQYDWVFNFLKIQPHPLDGDVMNKLFGLNGYSHFTFLGSAFVELQTMELVVSYDNKRVLEAVAKLKKKEPARTNEIEEYETLLLTAIEEHYQQEAEKIKKAVLLEQAFLAKFYQIAQKLLKTAQEKILESKKITAIDVKQIGPVPPAFKISRDFFSNPKLPADPARAAGYRAFLNEIQISSISTAPL